MLSVRYTKSQLFGHGALTTHEIMNQLIQFGFDPNLPIKVKYDCDSKYYQQGSGNIVIPEYKTKSSEDQECVDRQGFRWTY